MGARWCPVRTVTPLQEIETTYNLVDADNQLLHTQSEGKQSVLTGLSVGGDTSLELTSAGSNDEDGAVGLNCC